MIQYYCSCEQIKMGQLCRGKQKCVEENKTLEVFVSEMSQSGFIFPQFVPPNIIHAVLLHWKIWGEITQELHHYCI